MAKTTVLHQWLDIQVYNTFADGEKHHKNAKKTVT